MLVFVEKDIYAVYADPLTSVIVMTGAAVSATSQPDTASLFSPSTVAALFTATTLKYLAAVPNSVIVHVKAVVL